MKSKVLIALLIITSLFGYLEWGRGQHSFLLEAEWDVFKRIFTDPLSVAHPLIFIPLVGQIILFITLFKRAPNKLLIYLGTVCIGILLGLMFIIGVIDLNIKIIASTLPFLITSFYMIRYVRKGG